MRGSSSCISLCRTWHKGPGTPAGAPGAAAKIYSQIVQISKVKHYARVSNPLGNLFFSQVQGIQLSGKDVVAIAASRGWFFWGVERTQSLAPHLMLLHIPPGGSNLGYKGADEIFFFF